MNDRQPRRQSGFNTRSFRETNRISSRPDRIAFWALVLAIVVLVVAAASAHADGGIGGDGCVDSGFGSRDLSRGDCGIDVQTLNWILRSGDFGDGAGVGEKFGRRTEAAVDDLQQDADIRPTGIVDEATREAAVRTMRKDGATWYGPGFWGNETACGVVLKRKTVGVAHKSLPCGTRVTIKYGGRFLNARVIDRGPYVKGYKWDLTQAAARSLRFESSDDVRSAIVR